MASGKEYSEPEVVEDDSPAVEEEQGVDAQGEDDAVANEPESKQVQNELGDLDQNNIVDGSRSNKASDPMAADKAIDQDIDNAEQELS